MLKKITLVIICSCLLSGSAWAGFSGTTKHNAYFKTMSKCEQVLGEPCIVANKNMDRETADVVDSEFVANPTKVADKKAAKDAAKLARKDRKDRLKAGLRDWATITVEQKLALVKDMLDRLELN